MDFDIEKINSNTNKRRYLESDILEQRERFEELWISINKKLQELRSGDKIRRFKNNLLSSEINVIMSGNSNSRMFVDYYLDLNDKSVKLDNIDILKANLFKVNYQLMSQEWAEVQKYIKDLRVAGLDNYHLSTFYYHYFACSVNKYLGYKLNTLKSDLKFEKDIEINGYNYEAKTNILKAITDERYFQDAIKELKGTAKFFKNIYQNNELVEIKQKLKTKRVDDDTIKCVIEIISFILRVDDEVPKVLLMKYFLDILNNGDINKQDVKIIYYIYVYSLLFTMTSSKKESQKLIRIVLLENWKDKIKETTSLLWDNSVSRINFFKKITTNGKVTDESGVYLPKHIFAIKEFGKKDSNSINFNEKALCTFLYSSTSSAEHFFINKSHKIKFTYGSADKSHEIVLPKPLIKYISCPINYLYIDKKENATIGNMTLKNKIEYLHLKGRSAFSSDLNYKYFCKIKEIFEEANNFPDLKSINSKQEAAKELRKYYKENMVVLMKQYEKEIENIF